MIGETPVVFMHSSRAEWGRGIVVADLIDRRSYMFEHGGERVFRHGDPHLVEVKQLPADEREALAKALLKKAAPARVAKKRAPKVPGAPKKVSKAKAAKAAKEAAPEEAPTNDDE